MLLAVVNGKIADRRSLFILSFNQHYESISVVLTDASANTGTPPNFTILDKL